MRSRLMFAVYGAAALWLVVFVAYLVYLLLPFGVGLLSTLAAALVALGLLAWLMRSLVWRPVRSGRVGRYHLATVIALAVATLTLDAGWTHYLVPFPPTDQDDCTFGPIGPEEFQTLKREMAAEFEPDWLALYRDSDAEEKLERQMMALLPEEATEADMAARIHALARSLGAEYTGGGDYHRTPYYDDFKFAAGYAYRLDLNWVFGFRRVLFRWARLWFQVAKSDLSDGRTNLRLVAVVMPSIKQNSPLPPDAELSCPGPRRPGIA